MNVSTVPRPSSLDSGRVAPDARDDTSGMVVVKSAASAISDDELAAIAAALLCHPERSEAESRDEVPPSGWLAAARREAVGLE